MSRLKYRSLLKITAEFGKDIPIDTSINESVIKKDKAIQLEKGFRLMNHSSRSGLCGDDFCQNMFTIVNFYDMIKVPRIISQYIKNKK